MNNNGDMKIEVDKENINYLLNKVYYFILITKSILIWFRFI